MINIITQFPIRLPFSILTTANINIYIWLVAALIALHSSTSLAPGASLDAGEEAEDYHVVFTGSLTLDGVLASPSVTDTCVCKWRDAGTIPYRHR